jgi:hypothetical protein
MNISLFTSIRFESKHLLKFFFLLYAPNKRTRREKKTKHWSKKKGTTKKRERERETKIHKTEKQTCLDIFFLCISQNVFVQFVSVKNPF